jgi:hypothetical protein
MSLTDTKYHPTVLPHSVTFLVLEILSVAQREDTGLAHIDSGYSSPWKVIEHGFK